MKITTRKQLTNLIKEASVKIQEQAEKDIDKNAIINLLKTSFKKYDLMDDWTDFQFQEITDKVMEKLNIEDSINNWNQTKKIIKDYLTR